MPGTFIISLDCEGKWGIPPGDNRIDRGGLTTSALTRAYKSLVSMLSMHEVPATFAFVMAFTLTMLELDEWLPRLTGVELGGSLWTRNFHLATISRNYDGWFCSEAFDLVRDAGTHEIACHGFRHVPLGRYGITTEEAAYELRNATELAKFKGVTPKTFVFPKNDVGNVSLLAQEGYIGFRNSNPVLGRYGRLGNLVREFNTQEAAQDCGPSLFGLVSIPGGHFLNWRYGVRRLVPKALTLLRWRTILNDAVASDRVALLWLHPENLSDSPETFELLSQIIRIAAELRDAKGLSIVTQAEYCAMHAQSQV
ncbi:hypothetical protein AMST5_03891 [freshwater sediment metagenome]|uniref:NodB homology domain-containing protein n=1 Tax=freshwater sediment metagenome TaxID=556182 RepID=A0AA48M2T1_9ZZZZ